MLGKLFASTLAKVAGGLILALALVCAGLCLWGRAGHAAADRWEAKAIAERDSHRATKANVRAAQEQAGQAARSARLATEEQSRRLAERADHAEEDLADARAAAARYADARPLPVGTGGPAGGLASHTGVASQADAASRGDGSGSDAVVLDRSVFDQFVSNTLRPEQVRRWGQSLMDAELAQSYPEPK
jgi:hypothetical protein